MKKTKKIQQFIIIVHTHTHTHTTPLSNRHLRRFDAAIALVRAQEATRKTETTSRNRSVSASHRKLYAQVKASQHRTDLIATRRVARKKKLHGREPMYLTPL